MNININADKTMWCLIVFLYILFFSLVAYHEGLLHALGFIVIQIFATRQLDKM